MSGDTKMTPNGSQTVGPFFRIGLEYLLDRTPQPVGPQGTIQMRGRVIDRDGKPLPDALLEFWSPHAGSGADAPGFPAGFRRAPADDEGNYAVALHMPAKDLSDGTAPHMLVLVFARGLLRHLIARVYFEGEQANESDPVLLAIPAERRSTLVARHTGQGAFQWDVVLQGNNETVFFAW